MRRSAVRRLSAAGAAAALGLLAACSGSGGSASAPATEGAAQARAAESNQALDTGSSLGGVQAPDIRLVNQFGRHVSLSQFRGKVVVMAFVDSECTTICPLTTESMVEAKNMLGPAGAKVQLLGVDANPDAIKASDVMSYSRAHGMVNQWDFLTGTRSQLLKTWHDFHIAVQILHDEIDHTPALLVIDQQGRERKIYLTQMAYTSVAQSGEVLAQEVASLLPGHPELTKQGSLGFIPGDSPATRVTLPAVPSGSARLGPGKPRLVMFFATWLTETSDLRAHLLSLNGYASAARGGRLPPLTAVDEESVEPSAGGVASYLKSIGKPLSYPVAMDASGRLADGYDVQDQPWFVLTSASGKVLWKHDGWLPVSALKAAVRKASA
jgi:cytochrome oxidase Cu insertion factor (SCO1/SenC/PrrC family)